MYCSISATQNRPAAAPVRTCVGCRRRTLAADLLRVVAQRSGTHRFRLVPDLRRRLPGRGAWLHFSQDCFDKAVKRKAFGRALRVSGELDAAELASIVVRDSQTPEMVSADSATDAHRNDGFVQDGL
nr:YlxR family protein [Hoyosella rhizosphaerae]